MFHLHRILDLNQLTSTIGLCIHVDYVKLFRNVLSFFVVIKCLKCCTIVICLIQGYMICCHFLSPIERNRVSYSKLPDIQQHIIDTRLTVQDTLYKKLCYDDLHWVTIILNIYDNHVLNVLMCECACLSSEK